MQKTGTQRHSLINPGNASLPGGRFTADVPSVHHRFNKDSVHLRSMYRQLYPQHKNSAFIMSSSGQGRLEDSDSETGSRVRSQLRKPNLVKSGEGLLGSAASHSRKAAMVMSNAPVMTARTSPPGKNKLNILQNTPQQMQQQRNNFLQASSSICAAMLHTASHFSNLPAGGASRQEPFVKRSSNFAMSPNASKFFTEDPGTQFITTRVEHTRPKPRIVYKDT